jgi:hypothetical protein
MPHEPRFLLTKQRMNEKVYGKLVLTAEEMIEAHFKACALSLPTSHLKYMTLSYLFVFSLFILKDRKSGLNSRQGHWNYFPLLPIHYPFCSNKCNLLIT